MGQVLHGCTRVDAECIQLSSLIAALTARLKKSQTKRDSCDRRISRLNNQIRTSQIEQIHAWQGKYGKRGAFKQELCNVIEKA